ncbi:MAG: hypothetical protein H0T89_16940 [Deltaproteobacteria bacterium]|nr:hypothetical protein [Deltaproteobacteria bacterium]MDQ3297015.1 hypothetical protein [Myxococcota bacterium]
MTHAWHFFRAGGVDQVSLRNGDDLRALATLDQKLWVALAMPVANVDVDVETLALMDKNHDGRIRVQDIVETVAWIDTTFVKLDDVLKTSDAVPLTAIKDPKVVVAARRVLSDLGKRDATSVSVDDANAVTKAFSDTVLNGDAIVIPASTEDPDLRHAIEDILACAGSTLDRSGKPGIGQPQADAFFLAVDQRAAWIRRGNEPSLSPLGTATPAASRALAAVRAKLEDHFTRCRIAAYDARGAAALAGQEPELVALSLRSLSPTDDDLAKLPLAKIDPDAELALHSGLNPAWTERMATFVSAAMTPILGARKRLVPADLAQIVARLAAFDAWVAEQPKTIVDELAPAWLERLAAIDPGSGSESRPLHLGPGALRDRVRALIDADAALAVEYDQITSVAKVVRLQRDFGRIVRNFVNFSDFYARQDGVFQAGTLYLDARAVHLCVPVVDVTKHAALATSADAYLMYCELSRNGTTRTIAAALTNGDSDNIFIGRNGIFYDRDGHDWDATVVKVIANPISIRQAFWSPYKKVVKVIEDNVTRRVSAADAASTAKLDAVGKTVANADAEASPVLSVKKVDLGTVAAIGVAIGGVATLFGALLATLFGLGPWLPLGFLAILLLISGPSMALAYLKLRRRNLGPILDANGWAINSRARINVAFGAAMTELAKLPKGSGRSLDDPFADKRVSWKRYVVLVGLLVLAGSWYVGKLDRWIPDSIRSTTVLGDSAPASKRAKSSEPAPAPPIPPKP